MRPLAAADTLIDESSGLLGYFGAKLMTTDKPYRSFWTGIGYLWAAGSELAKRLFLPAMIAIAVMEFYQQSHVAGAITLAGAAIAYAILETKSGGSR